MTRKEAIEILQNTMFIAPSEVNVDKAIDMAIESLSAEAVQGYTDLISRQDTLDKAILVPIAKVVTEDKVIYRRVVFVEDIESLPSVEPKTGEWIWSDEDASWKCGYCDCVFEEIDWKPDYNFCPNCGARMKGSDTE